MREIIIIDEALNITDEQWEWAKKIIEREPYLCSDGIFRLKNTTWEEI